MTLSPLIKIVSLDGNIGSGKSTIAKRLKSFYNDCENINPGGCEYNVVFLDEPVDDWCSIRDNDGKSLLQKFYNNQAQYSFAFQMAAYISRLALLRTCIQNIKNSNSTKPTVIITERCIYSDKFIFAKMLHDEQKIDEIEYKIYLRWFDTFVDDFPAINVIYINSPPQICQERIKRRCRQGEEIIPLDYLKKCHEYHGSYLKEMMTKTDANSLTINCEIDVNDKNKYIETEWILSMVEFIEQL